MAVLPMKHVRICALRRDRKAILEMIQRLGTLEVCEASGDTDAIFSRQDVSRSAEVFQKNRELADAAIAVLEQYCPADKGILSSLAGRRTIGKKEYEKRVTKRDEILETCRTITDLEKERQTLLAKLPGYDNTVASLAPWMALDVPLDFKGTRTTDAFIGTFSGERTKEELEDQLRTELPDLKNLDLEVVSASKEQTCVFIVTEKSSGDALLAALKRMNFASPSVDCHAVPAEEKKRLLGAKADDAYRAEECEKEIRSLADARGDIEFLSDYLKMREEKYGVIGTLLQSDRVFFLEGYAAAKAVPALEKKLTGAFDMVFEAEDPAGDEDVPVILQNNAFAAPVEGVVESYSMPGPGERDPSSLVAVFYYVLFGFMLSDAGYGILMFVLSEIILKKFKQMESGTRKTLMMLRDCGIATTVVGFLFGSFFGNAVNVIATTFFNRPDITLPALWLDPLKEPMRMLGICFLVGIIHLFVGLGAKLYDDWKSGKILDGIYDCVFWYMFVGGLILWLLTLTMVTDMFAMEQPLPGVCAQIGKVLALVGFVGVVLTSGRSSKNWFKRLLKGLYGAYGISSWLSDILSYSRLLALGLATSVISQVFNTMGSMVATGNGFFGVIAFIVIFVIGHILNLLINALGAYVHTNRLTFVEFFGKFYDGGGRAFQPFREHTKYFNITEENES